MYAKTQILTGLTVPSTATQLPKSNVSKNERDFANIATESMVAWIDPDLRYMKQADSISSSRVDGSAWAINPSSLTQIDGIAGQPSCSMTSGIASPQSFDVGTGSYSVVFVVDLSAIVDIKTIGFGRNSAGGAKLITSGGKLSLLHGASAAVDGVAAPTGRMIISVCYDSLAGLAKLYINKSQRFSKSIAAITDGRMHFNGNAEFGGVPAIPHPGEFGYAFFFNKDLSQDFVSWDNLHALLASKYAITLP